MVCIWWRASISTLLSHYTFTLLYFFCCSHCETPPARLIHPTLGQGCKFSASAVMLIHLSSDALRSYIPSFYLFTVEGRIFVLCCVRASIYRVSAKEHIRKCVHIRDVGAFFLFLPRERVHGVVKAKGFMRIARPF
jgi:hypothetical protein